MVSDVNNLCVIQLYCLSCYLMSRALLWPWCAILYFADSVYGDCGTEFEVEYKGNSQTIFALTWIDVVDVAASISLTVISCTSIIFMDSLKEFLQVTFPPTSRASREAYMYYQEI